jgi:hypothetical protein
MGLESDDAKTLMAVGTGRALGSRLKSESQRTEFRAVTKQLLSLL